METNILVENYVLNHNHLLIFISLYVRLQRILRLRHIGVK